MVTLAPPYYLAEALKVVAYRRLARARHRVRRCGSSREHLVRGDGVGISVVAIASEPLAQAEERRGDAAGCRHNIAGGLRRRLGGSD